MVAVTYLDLAFYVFFFLLAVLIFTVISRNRKNCLITATDVKKKEKNVFPAQFWARDTAIRQE
ncbi:hypothetical protein DAPPUDRAFT_332704 [Daphnia pulex]|uniref:Uncharacterized protein n=1 Tax=Daphnia pulex TaxID=6669 RepID=E9HQQ9_DAPPU|nr:hypothetical protein DAPPUDRAFT_332704 [Daphnia pulex]|eukprot:EFX65942.1 hypothetical protein DAPPUDRAFT_332704 [Daphnia pulex]